MNRKSHIVSVAHLNLRGRTVLGQVMILMGTIMAMREADQGRPQWQESAWFASQNYKNPLF